MPAVPPPVTPGLSLVKLFRDHIHLCEELTELSGAFSSPYKIPAAGPSIVDWRGQSQDETPP